MIGDGDAAAPTSSASSEIQSDDLNKSKKQHNLNYQELNQNKSKLKSNKSIQKQTKSVNSEELPRRENVHISEVNHLKLLKEFDQKFVDQIYDELSLWKTANPSKKKETDSDIRKLRKWVILAIRKRNIEEAELTQREQRLKKLNPGGQTPGQPAVDVELIEERRGHVKKYISENWSRVKGIMEDKVMFVQIGNDKIYYDNPKFKDLSLHSLKKLNL